MTSKLLAAFFLGFLMSLSLVTWTETELISAMSDVFDQSFRVAIQSCAL